MTQSTAGLKGVFPDIQIVDADTHITEPPDLWTSRAPASYKSRVPAVRRVDGRDQWFVDGEIPFGSVGSCVIDRSGQKKLGVLGLPTFEELDEAAYKLGPRLEKMDALGIYAQIAYPNTIGFGAVKFMEIPDAELRRLCVTAYNDAMAEWQHESGQRIFPQAAIPFWDLDATIAEMKRIKDLGLTGLVITDRPEYCDLPDYGDPYWDPFWDACNDAELPINFHIAGNGQNTAFTDSAWPSLSAERSHAIGATNIYLDNVRMFTNLLFSGLFDRWPKLKFVSVESGIGWIPFVLEASEYQMDEMVPTDRVNLSRRPTEYFRDHIYACFWFESLAPRTMLETIGVNNVMFETDFPHPTCLYPRSRERMVEVLSDLDPHVRRRVLQDNAAELYRVPLETA